MDSNNLRQQFIEKLGEINELNDLQLNNFTEEIQKNNKKITTLQKAAMKLKLDYRKAFGLAENRKIQIGGLNNKIIQLQDQLKVNEKLELENQQLKEKLDSKSNMEDEFLKLVGDFHMDLRQRERSLQGLVQSYRILTNKESENKDKLEKDQNKLMKNKMKNMASLEQQKDDENILKLAEDQKRHMEELNVKILRLEKELHMKQKLEVEIEKLQRKLNVLKHMKDGDEDVEVLNKIETLMEELIEKEYALEDLEEMNNSLIVKQRKTNDELQDARNELLNFIKEIPCSGNIGVKRMGELDIKPFLEAMKKKYNEEEAEERASELCSLWEEYLKDPCWHPFDVIEVEGKLTEIISDDDEKLNGLRSEIGEGAYNAVVTALKEINEYNPSGRYISSQVWNFGQGRVATLQEGLQVLLKQLKPYKRKRGMK